MSNEDKPVGLLYTGGTIGMTKVLGDPVPAKEFLPLVGSLPGAEMKGEDEVVVSMRDGRTPPIRVRLLAEYASTAIDSSKMAPTQWLDMANAAREAIGSGAYSGIVVVHGTDTMAWTASALSFLLGSSTTVPVIVTGSQRPLCFTRSDGPRNLLTAIEFARKTHTFPEVGLCFDNRLLRGNRSTKVSVGEFTGFDSPNCRPLGSAGIDLDLREVAHFSRHDITVSKPEQLEKALVFSISAHPGVNSRHLPRVPENHPRLGVLLDVYGSGTASEDELRPWLRRVKAAGGLILVRSRVPRGTVNLGQYGASGWLLEADVDAISGYNMTSEASYTKLLLALAADREEKSDDVRTLLGKDLCGEVDIGSRDHTNVLRAIGMKHAKGGKARVRAETPAEVAIDVYSGGRVACFHYLGAGKPLTDDLVQEFSSSDLPASIIIDGVEHATVHLVVAGAESGPHVESRAEGQPWKYFVAERDRAGIDECVRAHLTGGEK